MYNSLILVGDGRDLGVGRLNEVEDVWFFLVVDNSGADFCNSSLPLLSLFSFLRSLLDLGFFDLNMNRQFMFSFFFLILYFYCVNLLYTNIKQSKTLCKKTQGERQEKPDEITLYEGTLKWVLEEMSHPISGRVDVYEHKERTKKCENERK